MLHRSEPLILPVRSCKERGECVLEEQLKGLFSNIKSPFPPLFLIFRLNKNDDYSGSSRDLRISRSLGGIIGHPLR